ncbi:hypothetical protein GFB19_03125 [Escherichia coli]|uniref:hypothetical protein n=1 Tax=Escherichia coli TaxID=562 RepID=UPI0018447654|nr:hypothetical protein [Escherichia coli]EFE6859300.1 hypothetical protein [Escherichia coli]EGB2408968.1 hypothetical protein [Escherichia coli]MCB4483577.1 hypothetical protein [Escherichia coli]CAK0703239.1 hypothetical protein FGAF467_15380 [Escherichia coli]HDD9043230.1 hypothetical protein [Escherichia coli]
MKRIIAVLLCAGLSGCATEAVLPSQAKQAPAERLFKYQKPNSIEDATLIVVRDKGFLGSGCFTGVYLNNERSAVLDPGEKAVFHLQPGEWNVAMKGEGKVCIADAVPVGSYVQLKSRETKAVRLFSDPSGNLDVKPLPLQ